MFQYIPHLGEELGGAYMLDRFSATIHKIYAAGSGSGTWSDALFAIETLTCSSAAVINLVPNSPSVPARNFVGSISEENVAEWVRDHMAVCPRVAAGFAMPDARFICDYMIMSEAEMDRDQVYDWYSRHDLRYFVGSTLADTKRYKAMWSLQRSRTQGHAQGAEIELVELLKPHLARALLLADRLGTLESVNRCSFALFDGLPYALFALDDRGFVLFTNVAAEHLLRAGDGLCCSEGRLRTRLPDDQRRLDEVIREAMLMNAGSGGWVRVSRANGGPSYAAFVSPLNCCDEEVLAAQAKVLVIVHDTADRRGADSRMLMEIYGLTNAEARLANALCGGHSIESAAALFAVQPATIRSQLKCVFRKTRVNRQQDLVRLVTSLSTSRRSQQPRR